MYNGEQDILDLRLNILDPHVDFFVIGEAQLTFSSKAKPLYFEQHMDRFKKFWHKIVYVTVENYYAPLILNSMKVYFSDLNETSYPFLMAFYQKEYLRLGFDKAADTDVLYYGDVDEIWIPQQVEKEPTKLTQLNYSMYLNRRSSEKWAGTVISTVAKAKQYGLSQMRLKAKVTHPDGGWHFSNMGGLSELRRKIESYDHQEINTTEVQEALAERYREGTDFLGRDHKNYTDESEWPQYLKDHREKYAHLLYD